MSYKFVPASFYERAGLSPIVYHFTSVDKANKILKSNKFILTTDIFAEAESEHRVKDKYFFLSLARSRTSKFFNKIGVIFTMDGEKLGTKYSAKPIDYWGENYRKVTENWSEQEDRLYSRNSSIPNASKYIKEISVSINKPAIELTQYNATQIYHLIEAADNLKLALFFYEKGADMIAGNKRKALPREELLDALSEVGVGDEGRPDNDYDSGTIKGYIDAYELLEEASKQDKLSLQELIKEKGFYTEGAWNNSPVESALNRNQNDFTQQLKSAVQNSRMSMNEATADAIDKLIKLFRRLKVSTVGQFYDKFYDLKKIVKDKDDERERKKRLAKFINDWKEKGVSFDLEVKYDPNDSYYNESILSDFSIRNDSSIETLGKEALAAIKRFADNWLWTRKLLLKDKDIQNKPEYHKLFAEEDFRDDYEGMVCKL